MSAIVVAMIIAVALLAIVVRSRGEESIEMPARDGSSTNAQSIDGLVLAGRKIAAIKLLRQERGLGLKEAKDEIDALSRRLGIH